MSIVPPTGVTPTSDRAQRRAARAFRTLAPACTAAALSVSMVIGPLGRLATAEPGDIAPPADPSASGCGGTVGWVKVFVKATSPKQYQGAVRSAGSIAQSPTWYCYQEHGEVSAQSKVCGFWGCSWDTKATNPGPVKVTYWSRVVNQPCRSGKNRYRSRSAYHYRVIDTSGGFPVFVPGPPMIGGIGTPEPEFTCK